MLQFTLYFISSISILAASIVAPAMGSIASYFPTTDPTLVKLILTMPALFMVPGTFISIRLCKKYGKKPILLLSLIIYAIGGCATAFMNSVESILVCRAILGFGVGILTPIAQSLPSDFFSGIERTKVVGRQASSISLGNMVCILLTGWLAVFSWRYTFLVYGLGLVVMVFVWFCLPNAKQDYHVQSSEDKSPMPYSIYFISFGMFLFMIAMYALFTNLAIFMEQKHLGSASTTGYVLACNSLTSFIVGFMLPRIHAYFKKYMVVVILFFVGIGYFVLYSAQNLPMIFLGSVLTAFAMGALMPTVILAISNRVLPHHMVKGMAFLSCGMFLGQFASPLLLDFMPHLPGLDGPGAIFASLGACILVASAAFFLFVFFSKEQSKQKVS